MSETVHYKGKLKPTGKTISEYIGDVEVPAYYDSDLEYFGDTYYHAAVAINGYVYEVQGKEIDPDHDIFNSTENEDGSIDFEVKYYNGGCSFDEAIEEALKN